MIKGGTPTIYVSDMDRAVKFYTETLGLKLQDRYDDEWAGIDAGGGTVLGLHPASEKNPAGKSGSITIGFLLNEPIEEVVKKLKSKGVRFHGPIQGDEKFPIRLAFFDDSEGNDLYLCETGA